jgi:hypothetical protein
MISTRALSSFDDMMIQGIKSGLVGRSDAVDQVITLEELSEIEENKMVILTISSYKFRLMVLIGLFEFVSMHSVSVTIWFLMKVFHFDSFLDLSFVFVNIS